MSFLWVIEKSLKKTLLTNQQELKECRGVWGPHYYLWACSWSQNPAALRERGPACSLSLPNSWSRVPGSPGLLACLVTPVFWPFECLWRCP